MRHITLPGVGREGQLNLKKAKVLIIGTGGLGSPISLYLAAAGRRTWAWWISMWWKAATCNAKSSMATAPSGNAQGRIRQDNACKTSTATSRSMPTTPP